MPNGSREGFFMSLSETWRGLLSENSGFREQKNYENREKIIAFSVAFLLALCFWFLVNLSRTFNITVNIPIQVGTVPSDKALSEELPEFASVSVEGEGWSLINFYNNPPQVNVNIESGQVNLFDQIREQMNAVPDVNVLKVQPVMLSINLEDRITQKKKINANIDLTFKKQYDFLDSLTIIPDSVAVSGAVSVVNNIESVQTDSITLENVDQDIDLTLPLVPPNKLVELNRQQVHVYGKVAEYTEGEIRVRVRTKNAPENLTVNFSPAIISIKYSVPIQEYSQTQDIIPYQAYVPFEELENDSTGFVTPEIVPTDHNLHIKLRSFTPKQVAYFRVIEN